MAAAMCLDNLSSYVLDQSKTVSYKWLSQELSIPAVQAKSLLATFVREHKDNVEVNAGVC